MGEGTHELSENENVVRGFSLVYLAYVRLALYDYPAALTAASSVLSEHSSSPLLRQINPFLVASRGHPLVLYFSLISPLSTPFISVSHPLHPLM